MPDSARSQAIPVANSGSMSLPGLAAAPRRHSLGRHRGGPALPDTTPDGTRHVAPQKSIEQLLGELRPRLHRYCARMTGSVVDGEDVVQETMLKAMEGAPAAGPITNPEGWLFRIAHHAALDFLRRRGREETRHSNEDLDMVAAGRNAVEDRQIVA